LPRRAKRPTPFFTTRGGLFMWGAPRGRPRFNRGGQTTWARKFFFWVVEWQGGPEFLLCHFWVRPTIERRGRPFGVPSGIVYTGAPNGGDGPLWGSGFDFCHGGSGRGRGGTGFKPQGNKKGALGLFFFFCRGGMFPRARKKRPLAGPGISFLDRLG